MGLITDCFRRPALPGGAAFYAPDGVHLACLAFVFWFDMYTVWIVPEHHPREERCAFLEGGAISLSV